MTEVLLLGLDPANGEADEREVEHEVEHLLRRLPVRTDLVCTHTVGGVFGEVLRTAASVRLIDLEGDALSQGGLLDSLAGLWGGAAVLADDSDGPSVEIGPSAYRGGARAAVAQARRGDGGRAVRFPGQDRLTGPLPVREVPRLSWVDALVPAVGSLGPDAVLDPGGHLRPRFVAGRLVLDVRPGPGGTVVPVERASVHACSGH
jgi:hypothetical protein